MKPTQLCILDLQPDPALQGVRKVRSPSELFRETSITLSELDEVRPIGVKQANATISNERVMNARVTALNQKRPYRMVRWNVCLRSP